MQQQHASVLKSLHEEIADLKKQNRDLTSQMILMGQAPPTPEPQLDIQSLVIQGVFLTKLSNLKIMLNRHVMSKIIDISEVSI